MHATVCLISCALVLAQQPGERPEWLVVPRLSPGQELVYRGLYTEEALGKATYFKRSYRLEARLFVLEAPPAGLEVALLTQLRQREPTSALEDPGPSCVRLELALVDLQGQLTAATEAALTVPVDGPATVESGMFVAAPRGRLALQQVWEASEAGRPPRSWKVLGIESVQGHSCLKLEGLQQSDDWDRPRADRTAWRRRDLVWVSPKLGVAQRVERTIERREPARDEPGQRLTTRYELESHLEFPGKLLEDRRREILAASSFQETARPLLPHPGQHGPQPFEVLLARINRHLENHPPTPYREAVLQLRRRVEAARRGEAPPSIATAEPPAPAPTVATGQKAPDFVTTDLLSQESVWLSRYLGRPVLLLFYNPASDTAEETLRFAQRLQANYRDRVTILACAVIEDPTTVRRQQAELQLTFPLLAGSGLRTRYGIEATPQFVVLDAAGLIQASITGWGPETPAALSAALRRAFRK